jgi:hypothetical protein
MSSQLARAADNCWIQLEAICPAAEELKKGLFAQLVFCTVLIGALALFSWPWDWPLWAIALCIFLGGGVWGGVLLSWLGRWLHGRKVRGVFGTCSVWLMRRTSTAQPFTFRAQQVLKKPVQVARLDVSLAYVKRTLQVTVVGLGPAYSLRDHQLWTATKTTEFEGRFFPANGVIEVLTEFGIAEEAGLRRERDESHEAREHRKEDETVETERTLHWQVRIDTILTDGFAVNALFSVPSGI